MRISHVRLAMAWLLLGCGILTTLVSLPLVSGFGSSANAQSLDLEILKNRPAKSSAKTPVSKPSENSNRGSTAASKARESALNGSSTSVDKPLSVTVSKTLYLPPAMYGQWSVSGTRLETNAAEYFSTTVRDIWILEREGDEVVISNPANGASAAVSVDRVDGDRATFHRAGNVGRNKAYEEIPTITVMGDTLSGESLNKIIYLKNDQVVKEYYAIYRLQAQRIGTARTRFRPEDEASGPDIEIEDVIQR